MVVTIIYFSDNFELLPVRAQVPSLDLLPILVEEFEYNYALVHSIYSGTECVYRSPVTMQDLIER
jgi:hypothetical protein